ncbi:hypothetical protein [Amnibacterium kyonggiense]
MGSSAEVVRVSSSSRTEHDDLDLVHRAHADDGRPRAVAVRVPVGGDEPPVVQPAPAAVATSRPRVALRNQPDLGPAVPRNRLPVRDCPVQD